VGSGAKEKGFQLINGVKKPIIQVDPRYYRPTEVESLLGDASKAKNNLGWKPKISFAELVSSMVKEDLEIEKYKS
jgi:GDPmannose 4,6-dehydratase